MARLMTWIAPALLAASLSACAAAEEEEPELVSANIDRGFYNTFCPGPILDCTGFEIDPGVFLGSRTRFEDVGIGEWVLSVSQGRVAVYDVTLTALCTDGNVVETTESGIVDGSHFPSSRSLTVQCPVCRPETGCAPFPPPVSELTSLAHLDF